MKIRHIDNSFYRLTVAQAKELSIDGKLPRPGYEKKVEPSKLSQVELLHRRNGQWVNETPGMASKAKSAWIKSTSLTWHDGKPVESGWTWALHLWFQV